jgi:integrase
MAVYKQANSNNWWYKFTWNGEQIRESTKQANKRVAEQMESARKTALAKGEVGIRDRAPVPTLKDFAERDFLPFVRSNNAAKPRTVVFYENSTKHLTAFLKLARLPLDKITSDVVAEFVADRQRGNVQISTVNRELATLRRMFRLAQEWGKVTTVLPRVRLSPGENRRERVLSAEEEEAYLEAATELGHRSEAAYKNALTGIRARLRGEQPEKRDFYLLRDVASVLIDSALRPEECFRLKWAENVRDGAIEIHTGKGRGSRRRIPMTNRIVSILDMRRAGTTSDWIFPAATKSGHIEASTLKKQHAAALAAAKVTPFVMYTFRHTCITRWAKYMDSYVVHVLAGHTDMNTTKRYVHPDEVHIRDAMAKVSGGHRIGHSDEKSDLDQSGTEPTIN